MAVLNRTPKPEPEGLYQCIMAHVSLVDGTPVRGGAIMRGSDPHVCSSPEYFVRANLSDAELQAAEQAVWARAGLPVPLTR
jgi:hypothetical protein